MSHVDYLTTDKVVYVDEFSEEFKLSGGELLDLDVIGCQSLCVKDSLLIISTLDKKGFLSIFDIRDNSNLGSYIAVGKAENELFATTRLQKDDIFIENGDYKCNIYCIHTAILILILKQNLCIL
ncbi:MAG: hypothetical protein R3Y50_07410 [Rikenellaceae bacterium]